MYTEFFSIMAISSAVPDGIRLRRVIVHNVPSSKTGESSMYILPSSAVFVRSDTVEINVPGGVSDEEHVCLIAVGWGVNALQPPGSSRMVLVTRRRICRRLLFDVLHIIFVFFILVRFVIVVSEMSDGSDGESGVFAARVYFFKICNKETCDYL